MLIISALLSAAISPAHAEGVRRDLQIAPFKDDFAVYDGEMWISPSTFAEIMGDEQVSHDLRRQTATRQTLTGAGVVSTALVSGGLLMASTAKFIGEDWRYSRSIRDPLFGDPGPPYARNYGPAQTLLQLSVGTALLSVGIGLTGKALRSREHSYAEWYTPERAEELIVSYNDDFATAEADPAVESVYRAPLQWELVEKDKMLEVHSLSGGTVSAAKFASLSGDVETAERIKHTRRVVTTVGVVAIAAGALVSSATPINPSDGVQTIVAVGIFGGGTVLIGGRKRIRSLETWYSPEEIEAGVEAYNTMPGQTAALPPAEDRELALQLGIVPGGLGLAARF